MATLSAQIEAANHAAATPGGDRLVVIQFNSWTELERCHAEWDQLLAEAGTASIFMTPEWLTSWWRAFGGGRQLCALGFRNSRHRIVALAPFYFEQVRHAGITASTLRFAGSGSGDSDDLDFIVQPGHELAVAEAFADWLQSGTHFDVCALETVAENSFVARYLPAIAGRRKFKAMVEELPHSFVELPRTWTAYLGMLAPDFRPLLTRYPKRLHTRFKVDISRCEKVEDLEFHLQTLFTLHQLRWTGRGEPGAFADPQRRDFYSRMANAFLRRGWLQFWSLTLENEIVAAQFCFRYRDTVYLLQEGFNPKYTAEKVGYALRAHILQQMIATGARRYDFLGGADSYKARFGSKQGRYLNLYLAGPSWKGRMQLMVRENSRTIKAWLKAHLPGPILALLQHRSKQQPSNTQPFTR